MLTLHVFKEELNKLKCWLKDKLSNVATQVEIQTVYDRVTSAQLSLEGSINTSQNSIQSQMAGLSSQLSSQTDRLDKQIVRTQAGTLVVVQWGYGGVTDRTLFNLDGSPFTGTFN